MRFVRPLAWSLGPPVKWLLTILWLVFLFVTPLGWIYQVYYRLRYKVWPTYIDRSSAAELARDNAANPQRTASTAAALMIGLALVTLVALLASGILASFTGAVDKIWTNADYAITAQNNFDPIPISAADAAAKAPGVEAVGNVRTGDARAFSKNFFATAVNPVGGSMFMLDWKEGSQAVFSAARRRRRVRRRRLRQAPQPAPRLADQADVRERREADVHRSRASSTRRRAARRSAPSRSRRRRGTS